MFCASDEPARETASTSSLKHSANLATAAAVDGCLLFTDGDDALDRFIKVDDVVEKASRKLVVSFNDAETM